MHHRDAAVAGLAQVLANGSAVEALLFVEKLRDLLRTRSDKPILLKVGKAAFGLLVEERDSPLQHFLLLLAGLKLGELGEDGRGRRRIINVARVEGKRGVGVFNSVAAELVRQRLAPVFQAAGDLNVNVNLYDPQGRNFFAGVRAEL
jgi:hypothetical protein